MKELQVNKMQNIFLHHFPSGLPVFPNSLLPHYWIPQSYSGDQFIYANIGELVMCREENTWQEKSRWPEMKDRRLR